MADLLLFGLLADARRARPRRFRLFNAHLDEYLSENNVKSKFRFARDSINYLTDLLCDDLARKKAFRYALPSPWALTFGPKNPGRISGNFHGQMVQSFSSAEDDSCSLGIFQWLLGLNHKYRSKQNTDKSTSWLFIDHNSRDLAQTTTAAKTSQNKGFNLSYNRSARVINLCTFPSQPIQNKQVHNGAIIFIKRFFSRI